MWLDRGELDKVIERAFATGRQEDRGGYREGYRSEGRDSRDSDKRKSVWKELFDF